MSVHESITRKYRNLKKNNEMERKKCAMGGS